MGGRGTGTCRICVLFQGPKVLGFHQIDISMKILILIQVNSFQWLLFNGHMQRKKGSNIKNLVPQKYGDFVLPKYRQFLHHQNEKQAQPTEDEWLPDLPFLEYITAMLNDLNIGCKVKIKLWQKQSILSHIEKKHILSHSLPRQRT